MLFIPNLSSTIRRTSIMQRTWIVIHCLRRASFEAMATQQRGPHFRLLAAMAQPSCPPHPGTGAANVSSLLFLQESWNSISSCTHAVGLYCCHILQESEETHFGMCSSPLCCVSGYLGYKEGKVLWLLGGRLGHVVHGGGGKTDAVAAVEVEGVIPQNLLPKATTSSHLLTDTAGLCRVVRKKYLSDPIDRPAG